MNDDIHDQELEREEAEASYWARQWARKSPSLVNHGPRDVRYGNRWLPWHMAADFAPHGMPPATESPPSPAPDRPRGWEASKAELVMRERVREKLERIRGRTT